jgi:hypothetical protein
MPCAPRAIGVLIMRRFRHACLHQTLCVMPARAVRLGRDLVESSKSKKCNWVKALRRRNGGRFLRAVAEYSAINV